VRDNPPTPNYVRIENKRGQLLFEFDPARDLIRIKTRGMARPELVDLAQYRTSGQLTDKPKASNIDRIP
jgi:hypothetical protein